MLPIKFSKIEGVKLPQTFFREFASSVKLVAGFILSSSACIIDHKFSIGFKSGELIGHTPFSQ